MNDHKPANPKNNTPAICKDFHSTIEFIGKRWVGVIIFSLLKGPKRYHEILDEIPGISDRLLTERLRGLEREGLVVKKVDLSSQKKVEYELTPAGKDLEKVISAIMHWLKQKGKK